MTISEIAALGTVSAAFVTYAANVALERRGRVATRRAEAYIDFLTGISRTANITNRDSKEFRDADISTLEAKHRVILYGSERVVRELALMYDGEPHFSATVEGRRQYACVLNAMRADCSKGKVSEYEIVRILIVGGGLEMPPGHPVPARAKR